MAILSKELAKAGLNSKESRIYLAALELGYSSVMDISKKAEINRPTAYVILDALMRKGLISTFDKGKKRYFTAEAPEKLKDLLDRERADIQAREEELSNIIPELKVLYNLGGEKPKVRFFEGKEGLRSLRQDVIKSKFDSFFELLPLDDVYKVLPLGPNDHRKEMGKKMEGVTAFTIYSSSKGKSLVSKKGEHRRRYVPENKFPFSAEINIYGEKVSISSYKGKIISVIIESKEISNTFRFLFELAWEGAKNYN